MKTKFVYLWVIQGNYGYGWDDLSHYETWKDCRGDLKAYRENERNAVHRAIRRRELNDEVQP